MESLLIDLGIPRDWVAALHLPLLGRLLLAALLGGLVGFEREVSGKPAGLRTNLLICVGSALFTELSIGIAALSDDGRGFRSDPGRIAAQVVSGIGFLGAGTILRARGRVTGLTTAATVWVVAAIGMAVGGRAFGAAVGTTALVMFSLVLLGRMERYVAPRRVVSRRYQLHLVPGPDSLAEVESAFRAEGLQPRVEALDRGEERYEAMLHTSGPMTAHQRVTERLLRHPAVSGVRREGA